MMHSKYLENLSDGLIVLDREGTIIEANPSAFGLLGLNESYIGKKYAEIIWNYDSERNDDFHQVIIDSIVEDAKVCRKKVSYYTPDGKERVFQVTSTLITEADSAAELVITMSDITETVLLLHHRARASFAFVFLLGCQCLCIMMYAVWDAIGRPFPSEDMSDLLLGFCFIVSLGCAIYLKLEPEECGLKYKGIRNVVITDVIITVVAVLLLIAVKQIMIQAVPGYVFHCRNGAFFDFGKYGWKDYLMYLVSTFAQEFCSRGIVHEQLRFAISLKHREGLAILLSSLVFATLHVHLGPVYMIGAGILLGALGMIYSRQRTILGLCIPHFVLGNMIGILGFVAW